MSKRIASHGALQAEWNGYSRFEFYNPSSKPSASIAMVEIGTDGTEQKSNEMEWDGRRNGMHRRIPSSGINGR